MPGYSLAWPKIWWLRDRTGTHLRGFAQEVALEALAVCLTSRVSVWHPEVSVISGLECSPEEENDTVCVR